MIYKYKYIDIQLYIHIYDLDVDLHKPLPYLRGDISFLKVQGRQPQCGPGP